MLQNTHHPTCSCCGGTGVINPSVRPLCGCGIAERDRRPVDQQRRFAALQRIALRGIVYTDDDGALVDPHGLPTVDYRRPLTVIDGPGDPHPMSLPPAVDGDLFGPDDALCSWIVSNAHTVDELTLLRGIRDIERAHGRGTVVAALDAAARITNGSLPATVAALRARITPDGWTAA